MKFFLSYGDKIRLIDSKNQRNLGPKLETKFYTMSSDQAGIFFTEAEFQALPPKFYGDVLEQSARILNTYTDRAAQGKSTGVMLYGEKGSGKSVLARKLCFDSNLPVLIIRQGNTPAQLAEVLSYISPCVVFVDEFEKIFDPRDGAQDEFLSLLDGSSSSSSLFIVTLNDVDMMHDATKNRPSRFYYAIKYEGLNDSFMHEYASENLLNQDHLQGLLSALCQCYPVNMDMLQSIVEEMNRYNEPAEKAVKLLNIKSRSRTNFIYQAKITDLETNKTYKTEPIRFRTHPAISDTFVVRWVDEENETDQAYFSSEEVVESTVNYVKFERENEHILVVDTSSFTQDILSSRIPGWF